MIMALLTDQKFSTFISGGNLEAGDIIVGLRNGLNTRFVYTGELPAGVVVGVSNGGTGATDAAGARINLGIGTMGTQNADDVNITGGIGAFDNLAAQNIFLEQGFINATPVSGLDIVNKNYVDTLVGGSVASVSGVLDRTTSTGGSNPIIDIAATYAGQASITTLGTITSGVWQSDLISPTYGGTGVNNGSNTLTLGGNLATSGAFTSIFNMTGATNVTFPTSGVLATTAQIPSVTPAALTKNDDSNVTLTLGGSPSNALLQGVSLTLGWTGVLPASRGGTGTASLGSGVSTALGTNIGSPGSFIVNGGALGTPSSGTLTNATGLPIGGISATGTPNSSTYLRGDGSWAAASGGGGELVSVQVLSIGSGTTYTKPAGITSIMVEAVGGGGGGGGSTGGTSAASGAGGGGAGGYFKLWIPVAAASYTYSVGAGGSSGVAGNNAGGTGGATTFSTATANGGAGGSGCPSVPSPGATFVTGGIGGAATGGTVNVGGDCGSWGGTVSGNPLPGIGGSSKFGAGARAFNISAGGNGAGGGGAFSTTTSTSGGNGTNGAIFVWEYA